MEQTQILPPVQTTKRGERAHVHAFSSSLTKKNESHFSCTYVNEKTGKAYDSHFPGKDAEKENDG